MYTDNEMNVCYFVNIFIHVYMYIRVNKSKVNL